MTVGIGDNTQSCDLVSLGGALRVCEMEVVLLNSAGPQVAVESQALSEAIFCSGETNFSFRGRFVLPVDWCMIGYIHHTCDGSWCHGTELRTGMAFTVMPEGISEFMLRVGSRVSAMLVPLERLRRKVAELDLHQAEISARLLSLFMLSGSDAARDLAAGFERVRERLTSGSALSDDDVDALLASHLQAGLSAHAEDRPQCTRGRRTHYMIVQRVEQFMRANMRQDIYLSEMCNAAGVSERALRYAFEDLLGLSPNRYLSMLRLCTACRSLSLSDASRRSVKSVALSCGLWDLSRFADHYRRVFGELPSDTLMRAPALEFAS
ncbi:helix-turn-helix domain-containing protein [Rhodanobacter sp. DHG33]|uniref:AraC family transcriptional regulator n=1 Tax=Rhodanobacter sp. DHG33 TaxID=2775921 RepID=UPI0017818760|nr:helix-turn-helix domain-containing protein [Rhodanobacter sp. DHG33]MBD8898934.1 AraC family transcriptional regulator [Rhodanobacter sp. DHG33]